MKTCVICLREINDKKDKWVKVEYYDKKKNKGTNHYHLTCWEIQYKERVKQEIKKKMNQIAPVLNNLFGGLNAREVS